MTHIKPIRAMKRRKAAKNALVVSLETNSKLIARVDELVKSAMQHFGVLFLSLVYYSPAISLPVTSNGVSNDSLSAGRATIGAVPGAVRNLLHTEQA